MNAYTKLPSKSLYRMLTACVVIVISLSLQTMIQVKDVALYRIWAQNIGISNESFSAYVTVHLIQFFIKMIVPVMFSVYAYFAYTHIRINYLFVFIWSVLLIGGFLFVLTEMNFSSVFYYLSLLGYAVLIFNVLSLGRHIGNSKNE